MMNFRFPLTAAAWMCVCSFLIAGPDSQVAAGEDASRMKWFNEAKTGMFIHWGPYSITGCEWKGVAGKRDAHMLNEFRIPLAEYKQLAGTFNPQEFRAADWVKIAKDAGLRYIVYVSKHHDGFAMFNSPSSDFDISDTTKFGRDPLKELAEECRRQGMVLCVYYSLGRDWSVPGVPTGGKRCNDWDFPNPPASAVQDYIERKAKPQLRELLTNYGPIGAVWFDTPDQITKAQSRDLREWILSIQPNCLVNARVGNGFGDFDIHEQKIPSTAIRRAWESCFTLNGSWGFSKKDKNWKSTEMIVRCLVDVAGKGGNFVINVGPAGDGVIPQPSVERLRELGEWMRVNGESIYGTTASRFGDTAGLVFSEINPDGSEARLDKQGAAVSHAAALPGGWRSTEKPGVIYIHLFERPADGVVRLSGVPEKVLSATLLADPSRRLLDVKQDGGNLAIRLPEGVWDKRDTVLKISLAQK